MKRMKYKFVLSPIIAIVLLAILGVEYHVMWKDNNNKKKEAPPPSPLSKPNPFALHQAARDNNFQKVESLIQKGYNVNKEDEKGITPFIEAVLNGDKSMVVLMMRNGARAQPLNLNFRHTPLRAACLTGNVHLIQLLLNAGADPNAKSEGNRTPLMGACFLRPRYDTAELSLPAVRAMLDDPRTNPLLMNSNNETALDLCRQRNYTESIQLLEIAVAEHSQKILPLFQQE